MRPLEVRRGEVSGGISRENPGQCTHCLWDRCISTKANSLWWKGTLVSLWIKLPARRKKEIDLLPRAYLNLSRLYAPMRTLALVTRLCPWTPPASQFAPHPQELRNGLSIFSQTWQRCPRESLSLAGLGEFRLLEEKTSWAPLARAASTLLETGGSTRRSTPLNILCPGKRL